MLSLDELFHISSKVMCVSNSLYNALIGMYDEFEFISSVMTGE